MTINHEDLIAEAWKWAAGTFLGFSTTRELDRGVLYVRKLVDALESTTARLREAETVIENTSHIHGPRKVWESDRAYTLVCTVCITEPYPCATVLTLSRHKPTNQEGT